MQIQQPWLESQQRTAASQQLAAIGVRRRFSGELITDDVRAINMRPQSANSSQSAASEMAAVQASAGLLV
eukprot:1378871-Prymnesium_polylepis.1